MKLRWIEREIYIPVYGVNPILVEVKKVNILQYLKEGSAGFGHHHPLNGLMYL
jgi:hypothetical protein